MATTIDIQTQTDAIARGKSVRVPIVIALDAPLKARGLHAVFHGAEETQATYTTYNAATKSSQTHTAVQHVDIAKQEFLLSGKERMGFFSNVADGLATLFGGGEHEVLEPGKYPFEVDVSIPAAAPASLKGKKCRVFYDLAVRIDIPLGVDAKMTHAFTLTDPPKQPPPSTFVRTRYPDDQGRGLLDSWFGPDVTVEAALAENVFRPGDLIEGIFKLDVPKRVECRAIEARLIAVEQSKAQGHVDGYTHQMPPVTIATPGTVDPSYKQEFHFPANFDGPPTAMGQLFSIDWFVQLELDVPWAKNPKIRVPIIRHDGD